MSTQRDLSGLKELYSLLEDSRKDYDHAAQKVHDPGVASFLSEKSTERAKVQEALIATIREGVPEPSTVVDGGRKWSFRRELTGLRQRFLYSDDAMILDECERGDRYLLDRFTAVRDDKHMPRTARHAVHVFRNVIETQLATLEQLNDSLLARI